MPAVGPSSIRAKITVVAIVISALAVIAGSFVLLTVLRQSMLRQLDAELIERSFDVSEAVEQFGVDAGPIFPGDFGTITAILDVDGDLVVADAPITADEVLASLPVDHLDVVDYVGDAGGVSGYTVSLPFEDFEQSRTVGLISISDEDPYLVYLARSLEPLNSTVRTVRYWALIAGQLFVGLIGLLAWLLTGRALRSVDVIRAEVDEITDTADLSRRVHQPASDDEVSRLASTMNRMLDRLQANDLRQQRFMSDAAHELRSPLASINAQLDVDLAHPTTADWPATAVAVRQDSERLQRIIESLLGLARTHGEAPGSSRLVDLDDVVFSQAASIVRPAGVTVDVSGVKAVTVRGSAEQLERVVMNLLTNAVRHAHSSVALSTEMLSTESSTHSDAGSDAGDVILLVDDDGAGIGEGQRELIFDRFVRLDESRSRDAGGTGLGLALAREIVTSHGGAITADVSPLGGARFAVRLPGA